MSVAVEHGLHAAPWGDDRPGAHVARAAKELVWGAVEPGHICPISMTYAVVPALRANADLAAVYEPLLTAPHLRLRAPGARGQARADRRHVDDREAGRLRRARQHHHRDADGRRHLRLVGHKWFTSAPMSDLFLTLAQAPGGLSCFLVPRVLPDGSRNPIRLQRLKDKLGNRVQRLVRDRVRRHRAAGSSARRAAASRRSSRWST